VLTGYRRIAEHWLRQELVEMKRRNKREAAAGVAAQAAADPSQNSFNSAGGFSAGRMAAYDVIGK
jgi:hypothetical protein